MWKERERGNRVMQSNIQGKEGWCKSEETRQRKKESNMMKAIEKYAIDR